MSLVLNGTTGISGTNALTGVTGVNSGQIGGRRNIVINGEMQVSQRVGTTATATGNNTYIIDRYTTFASGGAAYTVQQVTDTPAGFKNAAKVTITTADSSIAADAYALMQYRAEGVDIAHLNCGTSDAETVTLSFWVKSSLTGNFGGAMRNSAADRNYPYLYNIAQANTWEKKSITLTLDTTGTWLTTTAVGLVFMWDFGSGTDFQGTADQWQAGNFHSAGSQVKLTSTNGATWYVTGVQLEIGSTATDFEHKSFGEELTLCQRYYQTASGMTGIGDNSGGGIGVSISFVTPMRATPSVSATAMTFEDMNVADRAQSSAAIAIRASRINSSGGVFTLTNFSSITHNRPMLHNVTAGEMSFSSEL
jgi:hypothetical protein